jgi:hypothetical protein
MRTKAVRFHLRTRAEGIKKNFTRPNGRKNKMNPGASLNVCAGIANGKIVMWHYLPKKWNGAEAAALYRGPILRTLRRTRGVKAKYRILEDNDPTGYKSGKAKKAKAELGISPIEFPRHSPDLNPLDYSLWTQINQKMEKNAPAGIESVKKYKARLRRTALSLSKEKVTAAVRSLKKRAKAVYDNNGGDIPRDC